MASRMLWLISSRHLPPERRPERLALDVGQREADRVERHLVDLEDGALGVEQPDELHHRVEGDPRDLLAVALAGIGGDDFRAADDERRINIGHRALLLFRERLCSASSSMNDHYGRA